jgi:copper chaperone
MKLRVTGMTCPHCEMAVRKALLNVNGVTAVVKVDRLVNEAVVEGSPDPAALVEAVNETGYKAEFIQ